MCEQEQDNVCLWELVVIFEAAIRASGRLVHPFHASLEQPTGAMAQLSHSGGSQSVLEEADALMQFTGTVICLVDVAAYHVSLWLCTCHTYHTSLIM